MRLVGQVATVVVTKVNDSRLRSGGLGNTKGMKLIGQTARFTGEGTLESILCESAGVCVLKLAMQLYFERLYRNH